MLNRPARGAAVGVLLAAALLLANAAPAAADVDPACVEGNPLYVAEECDTKDGQTSPPPDEWRCFHRDVEVDCLAHGSWVGDITLSPYCMAPGFAIVGRQAGLGGINGYCGDSITLEGCWRSGWDGSAPPPEELGEDATGGWYTLVCLGDSTNVNDPSVMYSGIWLPGGQQPDPEQLARSLLARIRLDPPVEVRLSPPPTGSVLIGMPLWLSVVETEAAWGPVPASECQGGVCVSISAEVVGVTWDLGDGESVQCDRDQNIAWEPGLSFMEPARVGACHYFYPRASRNQPNGTYQVVATTTWESSWEATQNGVVIADGTFPDLTDVCGPGGNALCQSTVEVRVEELRVVTGG